ncbi:PfkB family carbohydrate kinase [Candidatus Omnitrophota bacterium]
MSILVVGTVALDTVQTPFGKVNQALGGSGTYSSVSASFFSQVKLVSIVGGDFPKKSIAFLHSQGIDTSGLQIVQNGRTFKWSGAYTTELNCAQTLKTELNLLSGFKPCLPQGYKNEKLIFLANIDPEVQLAVLEQLNKPGLVVLDTMNYWIEHNPGALRQVAKKSQILTINDAEARQFSKQSNLLKAAGKLLELGPRVVIIKRGEYGCLLFSRSFSFCIPAYLLERPIDPTGAGDTFAGGFLGYLAGAGKINQATLKTAVVFGSIMASFVVEDFSLNRLRKLTKAQIQQRFREFQRLTRF